MLKTERYDGGVRSPNTRGRDAPDIIKDDVERFERLEIHIAMTFRHNSGA